MGVSIAEPSHAEAADNGSSRHGAPPLGKQANVIARGACSRGSSRSCGWYRRSNSSQAAAKRAWMVSYASWAGPRQSRLALHDRSQGPAGPPGVIAQGGGDAGVAGQAEDRDGEVGPPSRGGRWLCGLGSGPRRSPCRGPSGGGLRLPSGPG